MKIKDVLTHFLHLTKEQVCDITTCPAPPPRMTDLLVSKYSMSTSPSNLNLLSRHNNLNILAALCNRDRFSELSLTVAPPSPS